VFIKADEVYNFTTAEHERVKVNQEVNIPE
jgi:hypothetical protein